MHEDRSHNGAEREVRDALALSAGLLTWQAQRIPESLDARRVIDGAIVSLLDALDDLTDGRITLARASALAEKAVAVGLMGRGEDDVYVPGPGLRARLDDLDVRHVGQLTGREADELEAFLATA